MEKSDNTIPTFMYEGLKKCKGLMLKTVLCTDTGNPVRLMSYGIVVLRFKDFDVELWNEEQPNIPGELTDLAKIRIHMNVNQDIKSPLGHEDKSGKFVSDDFFPIKINQTIHSITIHNEKIKCFDARGIEQFELDNTRAIVISLGDRFLHIEKDCSWSEIWNVSIKNNDSVGPSSEWENEEDSFYEVQSYAFDL